MKKYLYLLLIPLIIPINVKATSTIAYEMNSNRILYSSNINDKRSVASISKIMTALLACESGKLDDMVTVGDEINKSYGSAIYIKEGEQLTLRDLVYGLMLRSGNDASYAIAKYVGEDVDTFVKKMNEKASILGMSNTTFNNPNGLDEDGGNISTAYDMALLTTYAMQNDEYRTITSTKKYTVKTNYNYYSWTNKNKLLFSYQYVTGGKTGYTEIAKRTLVTTASKDNLDVVVVTLNDGNDFNDHKKIYEQIFKDYKGYYILKRGDISVLNTGNDDTYYIQDDFIYPLKDNEKDNVKIKFVKETKDTNTKEPIGKVTVYLGDEKLGEEEVYIKKEEKVTLWNKILKIIGISG